MKKKILLVDCCVRGDQSRTLQLAKRWLDKWEPEGQVEHLKLYDLDLTPLPLAEVEERKDTALAEQFAQADEIVVAAPYWDLSFPSILKVYLERICVSGITFHYVGDQAEGLCRAKKAVYISTAGGYVGEHHMGEAYVQTLCQQMFGIPEFTTVRCEGLDIWGNDPEALLAAVEL